MLCENPSGLSASHLMLYPTATDLVGFLSSLRISHLAGFLCTARCALMGSEGFEWGQGSTSFQTIVLERRQGKREKRKKNEEVRSGY